MNRRCAFAFGTAAALGLVFFAGTSVSPGGVTPVGERVEVAKPAVVIGHRTAVFNMAAVMRDFHQAKY